MKTLNIPKIREEHTAIKITTIIAWILAVLFTALYLTNFGAAPDYAPTEYKTAMTNIHNLLVFGPIIFGFFGSIGLWLLKTPSVSDKQTEEK
jgi:hypothetical protein